MQSKEDYKETALQLETAHIVHSFVPVIYDLERLRMEFEDNEMKDKEMSHAMKRRKIANILQEYANLRQEVEGKQLASIYDRMIDEWEMLQAQPSVNYTHLVSKWLDYIYDEIYAAKGMIEGEEITQLNQFVLMDLLPFILSTSEFYFLTTEEDIELFELSLALGYINSYFYRMENSIPMLEGILDEYERRFFNYYTQLSNRNSELLSYWEQYENTESNEKNREQLSITSHELLQQALNIQSTALNEVVFMAEKAKKYYILKQAALIFFGVGLFFVLYFSFGSVYVSVMNTIAALKRGFQDWEKGELNTRVHINTRDELHEIGETFNQLAMSFEEKITENKQILVDLADSLHRNKQLMFAINSLDVGVMMLDVQKEDYPIMYVNSGFEELTGYHKNDVLGKPITELQFIDSNVLLGNRIESLENSRKVMLYTRKDGTYRWCEQANMPVRNKDGKLTGYCIFLTDRTQEKKSEDRMKELAFIDSLTRLPNRNYLEKHIDEKLAEGMETYTIFYIDINRFSRLNDSLGYENGDLVLIKFARMLEDLLFSGMLAVRMEKDEFIVFLPNNSDKKLVKLFAQELQERLSQTIKVDGRYFYVTVSIGVVTFFQGNGDTKRIIQNGEIALSRAKEEDGYEKIVYFNQEMVKRNAEMYDIENEIRKALNNQEFKLVYQPKYNLKTGNIVGVETLLRWEHPERGMISPAIFIPIAEETGIIHELGKWVLREAVKDYAQWKKAGVAPANLSVNISANQFKDSNLLPFVVELVKEYQLSLDEGWLDFELTESALFDFHRAQRILKRIKAKGITISIDDFGTGYSSLSYLQHLPIDSIKIDRMFLQSIENSSKFEKSLLKVIIDMAHSIHLPAIAEGVETGKQLKLLEEYGCDQAQGFYFSKPLSKEEIYKLLTVA